MSTNSSRIVVDLQLINFLSSLLVTYIRHCQGKCRRLSRYLLKEIQIFVSFFGKRFAKVLPR